MFVKQTLLELKTSFSSLNDNLELLKMHMVLLDLQKNDTGKMATLKLPVQYRDNLVVNLKKLLPTNTDDENKAKEESDQTDSNYIFMNFNLEKPELSKQSSLDFMLFTRLCLLNNINPNTEE